MKTALFSALVVLALPVAASAVTLTEFNTGGVSLSPGESTTIDFETDGTTYKIDPLSFTANGSSMGDIELATVSYGGTTYSFPEASISGGVANSSMFTTGFTTSEDFSITFYYGAGSKDVVLTYAFDAVPDVPLPASLPLLLAGVGGIGALRLRRRQAAA